MDTVERLCDIASRIDHLENCAEWISRETANADAGICQTASLIGALAEEIREKICNMVKELEINEEQQKLN
jgi:hypothetical protein